MDNKLILKLEKESLFYLKSLLDNKNHILKTQNVLISLQKSTTDIQKMVQDLTLRVDKIEKNRINEGFVN